MKHALVLCLISGCGALAPGSNDGPDPVDPDGSGPGAPGPAEQRLVAAGVYQVVSRVDLTVEAVLPEQAEQAVSTLRALSDNPARALLATADEAGVPAIAELYGALPGPVADQLEGWINDEIARVQIDGMPVSSYAGQIAALADTTLTHFALDSELTITAGSASHRLTALDLSPTGVPVTLPIGGLAGELLTQDTTAALGGRGALTLGEQHFGLDYGAYVWEGIEAASRARFGGGIREVLGAVIGCPRLARNVAGHCVLGVCVGHEAELTEICEGGLDATCDLAHDRIADFRIEVLHLAGGAAVLVDDDRDGIADRMTGGTWQAELDLGQGLRHAPATFTAAR
ncbi:MAG TPA: hypothetical protein VF469_37930 [Kofleriaceae bacterium]